MVEMQRCINVYSELNEQIDFCVIVDSEKNFGLAYIIIDHAYDDWFENESCDPIADYISCRLKECEIGHTIYLKEEEKE